jgi:gluconolactonase
VSDQFLFTEGPIWDPANQVLYFTDINGDAVYRFTPPSTFDVVLQPAGHPDGLALDAQGSVIAAGYASRDIWRLHGSSMETLVDAYQGKKLNSPDDLIARSDGIVYFTDPTFGIAGGSGLAAQTQEQSTQGVYRLATDGTVTLEDSSTSGPNGVELSPDERTLYVSYTNTGEVDAFDVASDGSLSNKRTFATSVPIADSMCVDARGDVYVATGNFTGGGGLAVFDPGGKSLGTIALTQVPTNCAFGGADQRTLYITARASLLGTPAAGNASLYRIDAMPIPGLPGRP